MYQKLLIWYWKVEQRLLHLKMRQKGITQEQINENRIRYQVCFGTLEFQYQNMGSVWKAQIWTVIDHELYHNHGKNEMKVKVII